MKLAFESLENEVYKWKIVNIVVVFVKKTQKQLRKSLSVTYHLSKRFNVKRKIF